MPAKVSGILSGGRLLRYWSFVFQMYSQDLANASLKTELIVGQELDLTLDVLRHVSSPPKRSTTEELLCELELGKPKLDLLGVGR